MRLAFSGWQIVFSIVSGLVAAWLVLVLVLALARPKGPRLKEALRLMPDVIRVVRRLAADRSLGSGVRLRLWLLLAYLAFPIDLIPDFIPVLGYADDAILVCLVLRSVVRKAGSEALRRHWPGTPDGLSVLWRAAGLPGSPDSNAGHYFAPAALDPPVRRR
jgi:uncharacterized membrane protein YkvA (DUF1232 family)